MGNYDNLETTAQRVYKYLRERIGDTPQFVRYTEIAEEVGRTRSSVSYAVGVLIRAGKISVSDGKITVRK